MKRILSFVVAILAVSSSASATDSSVNYVGDTGISLSLPASNYIITPNTPITDPLFSALGIDDPQAVLDQNKTNGILIDSVDMNCSYEITVGSPDVGELNGLSLSDLDDATLNNSIETLISQFENAGVIVTQHSVQRNYPEPYVVLDLSQTSQNQTIYSREYYTFVDGTPLYVTLHDLSGSPLSDANMQVLDTVVKSVSFPASDKSLGFDGESQQTTYPRDESSVPFHETRLYDTLVKAFAGFASAMIIFGIASLVKKIKK